MHSAYAAKVYGVLRVVKGKVQIKDSKDKVKKARIGQKVYPKDTIITEKDSRAKIVMVDKNEINVSPESQVVIQNYEFDPKSGKKDVLLNVIYGKIRNKVKQKYNGDTAKFQVKTKSAVAGVRGTDFLTSFNPKNNATNVVTFTGQVAFGTPKPGGGIANAVNVNPGQFSQSMAGKPPGIPKAMSAQQLSGLERSSDAERAPAGAEPDMPGSDSGNSNKTEREDSGEGHSMIEKSDCPGCEAEGGEQEGRTPANDPNKGPDDTKSEPSNPNPSPSPDFDPCAGGACEPTEPMPPPKPPTTGEVPKCLTCDRVITNGNTKLKVNIKK